MNLSRRSAWVNRLPVDACAALPEDGRMLKIQLSPRFNDTDALGHINNTIYGTWFEEGRRPFFRFFIPDLSPKKWNLIVARVELDFLAQGHFPDEVTIESHIEKIGNSSLIIVQDCFQKGTLIAKGRTFLVHFDYQTNTTVRIPDDIRASLTQHLQAPAAK